MPSALVAPSAPPEVVIDPELLMLFEFPVAYMPLLPGPDVDIKPLFMMMFSFEFAAPVPVLMPAESTVMIDPELMIRF